MRSATGASGRGVPAGARDSPRYEPMLLAMTSVAYPYQKNAMPTQRRRKSKSVSTQSVEMAIAAPQVVMHRLARIAMAGAAPSSRDRREFHGMVSEKQVAFSQAWIAMATETLRLNQAIAFSLFNGFRPLGSHKGSSSVQLSRTIRSGTDAILAKGLAPLHRKAIANAKRLGKSRNR